jgi:hypothetical protein
MFAHYSRIGRVFRSLSLHISSITEPTIRNNVKVAFLPIVEEGIHLMKIYKDQYFNLLIPNHFVVPSTTTWPTKYYGYKLGKYAKKIRAMKKAKTLTKVESQLLEDMNFIWDKITYKSKRIVNAFQKFKEIHDSTQVPKFFIVPHSDPLWPKELAGIKLGMILHNVRHRNHHSRIHSQLKQLGCEWDCFKREVTFDDIKNALLTFHQINHHYEVGRDFYIKKRDSRYPKILRGRHLWNFLARMEYYHDYAERRSELTEIGYYFRRSRFTNEELFEILTLYQNVIDPQMQIPRNFVIPPNSLFPQRYWYRPLGKVYRRLLLGNSFLTVRSELIQRGLIPEKKLKVESM